MASYSTRQRDPLLDSTTQAILEKRGKELLGLGLIALGVIVGLMVGSYSPEDPSWMLATDAPVQNWMGRMGASIAAPLMLVVGKASWWLALIPMVWGLRLTLHYGAERAFGRLVFFPIPIVVAAIYFATYSADPSWTHSFGYGGMLGDTVLGMILTPLVAGSLLWVKVAALISGIAMLALGAFVLGFTMPEIRTGWRFFLYGLVVLYDLILRLVGRGADMSVRAAQVGYANVQSRRDQVRSDRKHTQEEIDAFYAVPDPEERQRVANVVRSNPVTADTMPKMPKIVAAATMAAAARPAQAEASGLRGLMPKMFGRAPEVDLEPELIESEPPMMAGSQAPDDDRIRARISDVIRNRNVQPVVEQKQPPIVRTADGVRIEPTLVAGRGPRPLVAQPTIASPHSVEPPVMRQPMPEMGMEMPQWDDETEILVDGDDSNIFADIDRDDYEPDYEPAPMPQMRAAPIPTAEPRRLVQNSLKRSVVPSKQARAEAQPSLSFEDKGMDYETPPLNLLMDPADVERHVLSNEALEENARMLEAVLDDYGIKGEIVSVRPGPVVTMYELEPAPGLKASRVIGLSDDIARSMSALSARVSTVPGRSVIGIELPNDKREMVSFREILSSRDYGDGNHRLPLALGKDIGGEPIVANLAKMPHLLIAGTTGSGKSVAINTMILSLLYKLTPDECRLIMIDPKMLELSVYDGIPHLLSPVVTDPKKAVVALKWVVGEMEERYRKMSKMGVRNIEGYNGRVRDALARNEMFERTVQTGFDEETGDPIFETEEFAPEAMPYIVVIVDEMADLMMVAGKEIEACIQRLAQMARASGIHLIMATQRPSVDVITGTIKANFPTRISFQVTSKIDSRTILGEQGAEQLLGMGDMLYMAGGGRITRIHGPFVSDEEVEEIVTYLKSYGPPTYVGGVVEGPDEDKEANIDAVLGLGGNTNGEDALYDQAVAIVIKDRKCSTSYIQRKLGIGYNKAARLVEQMEDEGVVSSANHVGKREILVPEQH
ncbi:DNA translocase FtsK [Marivivens donghaensis]|jgi:DNA segregation ATPase FtsK/SpoIIIE, S-DNA-T family|uniref:DNA translocase FtsK n=1 Tax=Marivivens donghaensis TaxID=1699413 RepID=UPI003F695582